MHLKEVNIETVYIEVDPTSDNVQNALGGLLLVGSGVIAAAQ